MHLTILDSTGGRHEAILLAAGTSRLRVVVRGARDTVELRRAEGGWFCEDGEPVEFESMVVGEDLSAFCSQVRPRTHAAGGGAPFA
jgi:hypothetical protein